jgi:hypothetical protein
VDTKVDKITGKGLSTEDFTTVQKDKLTALSPSGFRGSYGIIDDIDEITTPLQGDYALLEVSGDPIQLFLWDDTNTVWTNYASDPITMTGEQIAEVLFETPADWVKAECEVFTTIEKGQLANHESIINNLNLGSVGASYGAVNYFNLTGTTITIAANSDGANNFVKINVSTALSAVVLGFDNGGANNGRLRYTGAASATFLVTVNIALEGSVVGDFVVGILKNGSSVSESRVLTAVNTNNDIENVSAFANVTLLNNEYLEVFIGRTSGALNPVIHTLSINAVKIS